MDLEMQRLANSLENYVLVVHSALFIIQVVLNFVPISLLMIKLQSLEEEEKNMFGKFKKIMILTDELKREYGIMGKEKNKITRKKKTHKMVV